MATAHLKDGTVIKYHITIAKLMEALYGPQFKSYNLIKWGHIEYKDQFLPATAKIINRDLSEIERAYL